MRRAVIGAVLAGLVLLALLARGGGEEADRGSNPLLRALASAVPSATPGASATAAPSATPAPSFKRARRLPLERRVAQLFVVGFEGEALTDPFFARLRTRGWGGVVLGGELPRTPDAVAVVAGEIAVIARDAKRPVPLVADATNPTPAAGITLALGPHADLGAAGLPSAETAIGTEPGPVGREVRRVVAARRRARIVSAVGHFPGEGSASQDPREGAATVGLPADQLAARDVVPFRRSGADLVMMSSAIFAAYGAASPAALEPAVYALLREDFDGVAITDDLGSLTAVTGGSPGQAAVEALRAGADMLLVRDPADAEAAYRAVLAAVRTRKLPAGRLDEAAERVLALKARYRLL